MASATNQEEEQEKACRIDYTLPGHVIKTTEGGVQYVPFYRSVNPHTNGTQNSRLNFNVIQRAF